MKKKRLETQTGWSVLDLTRPFDANDHATVIKVTKKKEHKL